MQASSFTGRSVARRVRSWRKTHAVGQEIPPNLGRRHSRISASPPQAEDLTSAAIQAWAADDVSLGSTRGSVVTLWLAPVASRTRLLA